MKKFLLGLGLVAVALTVSYPALAQSPVVNGPHWVIKPLAVRTTKLASTVTQYPPSGNWGVYDSKYPDGDNANGVWIDSLTSQKQGPGTWGGPAGSDTTAPIATTSFGTSASLNDTVGPVLALYVQDAGNSTTASGETLYVWAQGSVDGRYWQTMTQDDNANTAGPHATSASAKYWTPYVSATLKFKPVVHSFPARKVYGASATRFTSPSVACPVRPDYPFIRFIIYRGKNLAATSIVNYRLFYGYYSHRAEDLNQ